MNVILFLLGCNTWQVLLCIQVKYRQQLWTHCFLIFHSKSFCHQGGKGIDFYVFIRSKALSIPVLYQPILGLLGIQFHNPQTSYKWILFSTVYIYIFFPYYRISKTMWNNGNNSYPCLVLNFNVSDLEIFLRHYGHYSSVLASSLYLWMSKLFIYNQN